MLTSVYAFKYRLILIISFKAQYFCLRILYQATVFIVGEIVHKMYLHYVRIYTYCNDLIRYYFSFSNQFSFFSFHSIPILIIQFL